MIVEEGGEKEEAFYVGERIEERTYMNFAGRQTVKHAYMHLRRHRVCVCVCVCVCLFILFYFISSCRPCFVLLFDQASFIKLAGCRETVVVAGLLVLAFGVHVAEAHSTATRQQTTHRPTSSAPTSGPSPPVQPGPPPQGPPPQGPPPQGPPPQGPSPQNTTSSSTSPSTPQPSTPDTPDASLGLKQGMNQTSFSSNHAHKRFGKKHKGNRLRAPHYTQCLAFCHAYYYYVRSKPFYPAPEKCPARPGHKSTLAIVTAVLVVACLISVAALFYKTEHVCPPRESNTAQ